MIIKYIMRYVLVNGGGKKKKKLLVKATIIIILLANNKIAMNLSHGDQAFWPVYVTKGNLDTKTR